jgi:hypothetical protein
MTVDVQPLREILHAAFKRYLTVSPRGFLFDQQPAQTTVLARILGSGPARTHYVQRKPQCRSLNGLHPIDDSERSCTDCRLRAQCTAQVRLDLFVDAVPWRLLLAHTSAKNFLIYQAHCREHNVPLEQRMHRLTVRNRGSWGEVRFTLHT